VDSAANLNLMLRKYIWAPFRSKITLCSLVLISRYDTVVFEIYGAGIE
jgi:hypothetical protein